MKHTGSCHCQAIQFEVDVELDQVLACNCSICTMKGHLLAFAPVEKFKLLSGENFISDYQFNKKVIHHYFCKVCGVGPFGSGRTPDGTEMRSINARCLKGVDITTLKIIPYNGKDI